MTKEVTVGILWRFLRGDRESIITIASAPGALFIGLWFVLSAALAREYDGTDLLAEPWHLVLPLAASLVTSFVLFCVLYGVGKARRMGAAPFGHTYLRFLGLYWLTAPLAWLYAVPVESFMTPLAATMMNLTLLALVSSWRVAIMIRVAQCLFNASPAGAVSVVMLFADAVAIAAISLAPRPVISIMGGISHTDSEIAILNATLLVIFACVLSFPVWLLATAATACFGKPWKLQVGAPTARPSGGLWRLAAASVTAGIAVLPMTQPQQRLAHRVDDELRAGNIKEAVAEMGRHSRSDYPARWDPPPRVGYGERQPSMLDIMEVVVTNDPAPWVRSIFTEKFGNTLYNTNLLWPGHLEDGEFSRYVEVLLKIPEGPSFAARQKHWLEMARDQPEQSAARLAGIDALLELAKSYDPKRHPPEHFARPQ